MSTMLFRLLRWVWRIGFWLVIGVVSLLMLFVIGIAVYSRTAHFHQLLHEQLLSLLRDSLDAEVSFEEAPGSIWQGIAIRNLVIRKDGADVISFAHGTVSVDLLSQVTAALRTSTVQIAKVTLADPVVHLVQDPKTGWNVSHLMKPPEQPPPPEPAKFSLPIGILLSQLTIENGSISVRLADGKELNVSALSFDGGASLMPTGMHVDVKTLQFGVGGANLPDVKWDSSLALTDENGVQNVTLHSIDLQTTASHLQFSGAVHNLAAPELAVNVEVQKLAAADVNLIAPSSRLLQDLAGTLRVTGPLAALQVDATLNATDGHLTSSVTANLSQSPPDAQGTVSVERFALHKVLALPEVTGEVTAQLKFQGTEPETLTAELNSYVSNLSATGKQIGDVKLSSVVVNGKATTFAEINNPAGYLYTRNQVTLDVPLIYEATVMLRNVNAKHIAGGETSPATNVNADLWVQGQGVKLEELSTNAKLTIFPTQVGATEITKGEFVARLHEGQATIEKGVLLANDTTVEVQGKLGALPKTADNKITYNLVAKNLTSWLALGGVRGKGAVSLTGTADGTFAALRTDGKILLTNVVVEERELQNGTITYQFSHLGSPQPQGHVSVIANGVQAGLPLKSVNADIAVAGLQPAKIQADVTVQDTEEHTHHLKTQVGYTPEQIDVAIEDLALQLPSGVWRALPSPHIAVRGSAVSIDSFVLQHADQRINASGVFDSQGPLNLQLRVNRLALEDLRPFLRDSPEIKGKLEADVKVSGTVTRPDVTANISTGVVTVAGQTYGGLSSQSTYRGERFDTNLLLKQDETHTLTVNGGLPISLPAGGSPVLGDADFRVRSDGLSIAFLELLNRDIKEVRGAITMDVSITGPVKALSPSGSVRLQQGNVFIKKLEQGFADVNVDLQLESQRVRLSHLSIRGGDGELTGSGTVSLNQYKVDNVALSFVAQRFHVINTREYRAALSGQVQCSGSLENPAVSGSMSVVDTTVRPDFALLKSGPAAADETITVVQTAEDLNPERLEYEEELKKTEEENAEKSDGLYDRLTLHMEITIPRDTWVYMREGSIELFGKLQAEKAPHNELVVSGAIETARGWVAIQNRKFRLEKGVVTFTGATPIDPSLDIDARYTLPNYVVDALIGGTAQSPTLTFTSDPVLEQADILSLLVFGKPANALSDQQKTTLQSQAVQAVTGAVAADLRQALAEQLGIEDLELDVGDNPSQSKIGVGKYVAPGVFVSTSQQLGGGNSQGRDVSVEYQLNDNWQLKASSTARGNNGVDIVWKKRY